VAKREIDAALDSSVWRPLMPVGLGLYGRVAATSRWMYFRALVQKYLGVDGRAELDDALLLQKNVQRTRLKSKFTSFSSSAGGR